jgi:hypothetical protein
MGGIKVGTAVLALAIVGLPCAATATGSSFAWQ